MEKLDVTKIKQIPLGEKAYIAKEYPKTQIFIHHTAGSSNPVNVAAGWNTANNKVSTPILIAGRPSSPTSQYKDGEIYQCFSTKYASYHLGLTNAMLIDGGKSSVELNFFSIPIEICSWGQLTLKDGKYYTYLNSEVSASEVCDLGYEWRGYRYYHKYSDAQIESLRQLLIYLCEKYKISKEYHSDMWDVSKNCLMGVSGIWTHVSVRPNGKWDCFPQPELVEMLKQLNSATA